jgi:hypothetical protein
MILRLNYIESDICLDIEMMGDAEHIINLPNMLNFEDMNQVSGWSH